jgi:hypothetical protein
MAKKRFKNGDILQIPLPNGLGFAYAQGIKLLEIDPNARYPTLIRIYNYRSTSLEEPIENFIKKELILCPLLIAGILPVISKEIWKIVGNLPLEAESKLIPHYKKGEPDEINAKQWYYLIEANISKKMESQYENVKHLETIGATGSQLVGTKIAMALIQDEGKKIEDYFKLNEYYEKQYYNDVITIPAYYKQPEFIRGKAITQ